jgi:outer membrane immunogenic protein
MRMRDNIIFLMLAVAVSAAGAQSASEMTVTTRPELAVTYTWAHTNAPPGQCGCFDINGASGSFAWPVKQWHFSPLIDVTVAGTGSSQLDGKSYGLTMSTYTAGGHYYLPVRLGLFGVFGEGLIGLAHSSGSLVQSPNPGASNAGAAFAGNFGGGVDLNSSQRLGVRLIEADYLLTTFDNGGNDRQNNIRLSGGLIFRF